MDLLFARIYYYLEKDSFVFSSDIWFNLTLRRIGVVVDWTLGP